VLYISGFEPSQGRQRTGHLQAFDERMDAGMADVGTAPLAAAEPKALRYRLLHVAARITRGQRRLWLRIAGHWPWRIQLAAATLAALAPPLRT
jgi:hypothetical protein